MEALDLALNPDLARWLGLLITDGSINKNGRFLKFTNKEPSLLEDFGNLTGKLFGLEAHKIPVRNRTPEVQVNSVLLIRRLNAEFKLHIGSKCGRTQVPGSVIGCKDAKTKHAFMRGVFDGDGSAVYNRKHSIRRIDLTSSSPEFLAQMKSLLGESGIGSRLAKTESRLLITRKDDIKKFRDCIGYSHPKRRQKLSEMLN